MGNCGCANATCRRHFGVDATQRKYLVKNFIPHGETLSIANISFATSKLLLVKTMQDQGVTTWHKPSMSKRAPKTPEMAKKAILIGQRILHSREQKGYTQLTLAAKVGVTPGAIGQYETGRNLPKIKTLERLAAELDVSTQWLMTGDDPDENVKAQTSAERDAIKILRNIPSNLHDAALAMLRGLADTQPKK